MPKRSLADATKDPLATIQAEVQGTTNKKKPAGKTNEVKMLNTRVPKDLIKKIKVYCANHELTMQEFVTGALQEKIAKTG